LFEKKLRIGIDILCVEKREEIIFEFGGTRSNAVDEKRNKVKEVELF